MIDKIKEHIFIYLCKRKQTSHVLFPHFDKIKTALVICSESICTATFIQQVTHLFQKENKRVFFWIISDMDKRVTLTDDQVFFSKGDFNFWGNIKRSIRHIVQHPSFDILFDLRPQHKEVMTEFKYDYLVLFAGASFNVGQLGSLYPFQMRICLPNGGDTFAHLCQMVYYLKNIHSND